MQGFRLAYAAQPSIFRWIGLVGLFWSNVILLELLR